MSPLIPAEQLLEAEPSEQYLVVRTDDDPAAGISIAANVPGGRAWELVSMRVALVTDATVANRRVHFTIDDGTTEVMRIPAPVVQAAGVTVVYSFVAELGQSTDGGAGVSQSVAIPRLVLPAGWLVRTLTTNIVAGDNWGRPQLLVREAPARGELAALVHQVDRLVERLEQIGPLYGDGR